MSSSKKIVLLGHFGVGKTSLLRRFIDNQFSEDYIVTIGVQIKKKVVKFGNNQEVSFIIWDLEGNNSVKNTRSSYLLGASAYIYVFDVSRKQTFENINEEIHYLSQIHPSALISVIGNKKDLKYDETLTQTVEGLNVSPLMFTSAKTGENVEGFFNELAELI